MRLCKDCKYYGEPYIVQAEEERLSRNKGWFFIPEMPRPYSALDYFHRCLRDIDLVTGGTKLLDCQEERYSSESEGEFCGAWGAYFKAKKETE